MLSVRSEIRVSRGKFFARDDKSITCDVSADIRASNFLTGNGIKVYADAWGGAEVLER